MRRGRETGRASWRQLSRATTWLPALLLLALVGCSEPSTEPGELETVDVAPGLEVSTDGDIQAAPPTPGLSGGLPGGFPEDLPLHLPASLIDYGKADDGRRWVLLLTPDSPRRVLRDYAPRLEAAGWSLGEAGKNGERRLVKGERRLGLVLEDAKPGTGMRVFY